MPCTLTIEKTVWAFDELSDAAKEKARSWYRDGALDYEWYDSVYEDAATCAGILGINMRCRARKLMSGATQHDGIAIWFSGFWSQGDGACFEGDYAYTKGAAINICDHAPQDKELRRIADELQALQRRNFYRLTASMKHRGHYYHSGCMDVDVSGNDSRVKDWSTVEESLTQLMRDFADWIYRQLETEHDWLNADQQVDESIRANQYEFDESGNRN